jgi:hypothetical protein
VPRAVRVRTACGPTAGRVDFDLLVGDGTLSQDGPVDAVGGTAAVDLFAGRADRHVVRATLVDGTGAPAGATELFLVVTGDAGACTVTARPGDDLQSAVESLPPGGGELCLAAGVYDLAAPLKITGRERVVVSGRGPATILRALRTETAVILTQCRDVTVRDLRAEAGAATEGRPQHGINGALTFEDCTGVRVLDCQLACPDAPGRAQACVTVRQTEGGLAGPGVDVQIERNRLEAGAWQVGALVLDAERATLSRNEVRLSAPGELDFRHMRFLAPEIAADLVGRQESGRRGSIVRFSDDVSIRMPAGSPELATVKAAADAFVARGRPVEPQRAVASFLERLGRSGAELRTTVPAESTDQLRAIAASLRSVGEGLVVGGRRATTVQVLDNVVEDALQGIHLGISDPRTGERETAGEVIVSRNVIRLNVPAGWQRERAAVYVANARSTTIVDTMATLTGIGREDGGSEVEGIRVRGRLGPFLLVRGSSLRGFIVGVRVQPTLAEDMSPMWLVAETMAVGGAAGLVAPEIVARERNVP